MINEDAPTMSAGNGGFSGSAAATGPVAGFDPLLGSNKKVKRRKYGTKKDVKEAKVDKKLPDHKRATARDKRYGNPHGSHELGGGIRKDRRADHEARRGVKEGKGYQPEIEHSKLGDAAKKKAEKKRKAAADSLPPHLRLDAMKKAFAHTNEEKKYPYGKATKKNPRGKRDQAELDRAQDYIKKNPDFGKKKKNEDRTDRGDQKEYERAKAYIKKHPKFGLKKEDVSEGREERSGKDNYLPFKVCYDGAEPYVLYARSVAEIKIELRKIYRPENHKKIYVKRLYPNEVIKLYYDLRQKALVNQ